MYRLAIKIEKNWLKFYELKIERVDVQNINLLVIGRGLVGVEGFPFLLVLA